MALYFFLICFFNGKETSLTITPIDFRTEQAWETQIEAVLQMETDGQHIFIRSDDRNIIKLDAMGRLLNIYAELRDPNRKSLSGFALSGEVAVLIDGRDGVSLFEKGLFQSSFQIDPDWYQGRLISRRLNSNGFGFDGETIVLPAHPDSQALGVVIRPNGAFLKFVGKRRQETDLSKLESLNPVIWLKGGADWYCLHKFRPWIKKYDHQFQLIREIPIHGEEIDRSEFELFEGEHTKHGHSHLPQPHFSDFKYWRNRLFVMSRGALYAIHANSGEIEETYRFYGSGFQGMPDDRPLTFFNFVILDDGALILSHPGMLWGHDLWKARAHLKP